MLRRREGTCFSSPSDDEVGGRKARSARSERSERSNQIWLAAITQFPGTVYFKISTLAALAHNATVAQEDRRIWRPDFLGSTLFLLASVFAILAIGRSFPWWIAWLNMIGSILFMISALASYGVDRTLTGSQLIRLLRRSRTGAQTLSWRIRELLQSAKAARHSDVLPSTGELINSRSSIIGTLLGALYFLFGAILMFPRVEAVASNQRTCRHRRPTARRAP